MANQGEKRFSFTSGSDNYGALSRVSDSSIVQHAKRAAYDSAFVAKKLFRSTGKAAWIAGTAFLILIVPLIIEMDRDQQLNELEMQQAILGASSAPVQN